VEKRNPELPADALAETSRRIAVGALRYYMLRFTRNRVVAFDLEDALSFEGETGPYLQYSVVRARNILAKVALRYGPEEVSAGVLGASLALGSLDPETVSEHWTLPLLLSRVDATVAQAVSALELAGVAKHAYILAQAFNSFYHRFPVAQEDAEAVRRTRIAIVRLYHDGMTDLLGLMGIEVPDRM
jgi:arginyl-tRNA synthetase